ncbi:NUDIX hydrolase [Candidatus Fermentibacteria bacterium]|nr:NUDIX hydrolase [Candidatus Fermentibacteria bacterium]
MKEYQNPKPTVDIIIEVPGGIVLIRRSQRPLGWALPGGFVDYGESLEKAAIREALEETGLAVTLRRQLYTYSDPLRDPRHHTVSTVFIARAAGSAKAGSDAAEADVFSPPWPSPLAFDHELILRDYLMWRDDPLYSPLVRIAAGS